MPTKDEIVRLTQLYWTQAHVRRLHVASATMGLRYGLIIALRHPNYARAYVEATRRPEADQFEQGAVEEFMATVPIDVGGNGA